MRVAVPLEQCWHDVPGGTAGTALELTRALAARADVDVVGVAAHHRDQPDEAWRPDVPVEHLRLPRRVLYETWHAVGRPRIESVTGPVDVCHAVGGAVPGTRAPLVYTVHDLAFLHLPELFSRHGVRFFRRALDLVRERAVQVQVPSLATLDDCVGAGIARERLRLVPWGHRVGAVTSDDIEAVRRRFSLPDTYVVFVGTLEPRKNLPRLLDAWRVLDRADAALVVVGPAGWGDDAFGRGHGDGSRSRVVQTGFVDRATRDALYAGAAASCYPSLFEGFGLPVLESMALGCPVVTSTGTSTEELVAGGAGLAVDPTDVGAIADAVGAVLDDPALARSLADAGSVRASDYTWERAASAAVEGYLEVLA